jgi:hypothetical protein
MAGFDRFFILGCRNRKRPTPFKRLGKQIAPLRTDMDHDKHGRREVRR